MPEVSSIFRIGDVIAGTLGLTWFFDDVRLNQAMHSSVPSRIPLRFVLAMFFLALTMAALNRPLVRAKFNFAPDIVHVEQGITRHTYLEVGAAIPEISPVFCSLATGILRPMLQSDEPALETLSARRLEHWPNVFSTTYRHIRPPRRSGSEPSA